MHLILPMAGHGKRFSEAGYAVDKPLINVNGKTLMRWSLDCIPSEWNLVTLIREDQDYKAIQAELVGSSHGYRIMQIPGSTQGAAMTVLTAAMSLPPDEPVAAMNCDQVFSVDWNKVFFQAKTESWDGFILTFDGTGPAWSYAITNGGDRVVAVIEKKPVSRFATVGFYWWRRCSDLVHSVCAMIASGQTTNGEWYLAPSYNFLPLSGRDVRIFPVDWFAGLGTPDQVRMFETLHHENG